MSTNFRPLGAVAKIIMGTSPKGSTYNSIGEGLPLLNGPTEFGADHPICTLYTTDTKRECEPEDLIFCVRGSTTGRMNWADKKYAIGRGVCSVRGITQKDTRFIRYALEVHLKRLLQFAGGATFPNLTKDTLNEFKIPFPNFRDKIVDILSSYDDLIENNRRRIQLLEQSARLLYNEWFVSLRFPCHEHVKIINGVPEGWERKKIVDVCETVGGGTPSTTVSDYWDGDITWVVPSDITRNGCLVLIDSERKISEKGLRGSSAKMVPPNTILMTSRASVGYFALMDLEVCTNQGFINIIPHDKQSRMYILFNLISRVNEIRSNAKGSTYPEISKSRFRGMEILVPAKTVMWDFGVVTENIVSQIRCLKKQILSLEKARDILLPRLMSGEVVV